VAFVVDDNVAWEVGGRNLLLGIGHGLAPGVSDLPRANEPYDRAARQPGVSRDEEIEPRHRGSMASHRARHERFSTSRRGSRTGVQTTVPWSGRPVAAGTRRYPRTSS
jgi:hypothetical protein